MATLWFELGETEKAMRLGARPPIAAQEFDANGNKMGAYLSAS
jgi:hypothetical protein